MVQRRTQTLDELTARLAAVDASSLDEFAQKVAAFLESFPVHPGYGPDDLLRMLREDFEVAKAAFQLFLGVSKDEFTQLLRKHGAGTAGIKAFRADPQPLLGALAKLGLPDIVDTLVHKHVSWQEVLLARLEGGRGRALKGQRRGRAMEDFTETIVRGVFGSDSYETRRRFACRDGHHTQKADFAIPSMKEPHVIIEAKAYGATGSKQTDVIGDIEKIVGCKRDDVFFLLVTDGLTWLARLGDLRKMIEFQNLGSIYRIYTMAMADDLRKDLTLIKAERGL